MKIIKKLNARIKKTNSLLCVGLDADFAKLPAKFKKLKYPQFEFNKFIIEQTQQYVCAYKPNIAFYEARGARGLLELKLTQNYLVRKFPSIVRICDAKRADIGNTNRGYEEAIFDELNFDAVTLSPYLGGEAIEPFLKRKDKTCIILCKTSNSGSGEFQDLKIKDKKLWQIVAYKVAKKWNKNKNCMLVVGATYPRELGEVRKLIGEMPILVPGIGAQGGDLAKTLKFGLDKNKRGLIINSSRGIIFAKNPQLAAKDLNEKIRQYCQ
jgi:orotidine-5'-phosphate decarboxylase